MIHFYHVYCNGNLWKDIVLEHFNLLKETKLFFEFKKIFVGIVGNRREEAKQLLFELCQEKLIIVNESNDGWEQETLNFLSNNRKYFRNDIIFYAHTKGASKTTFFNFLNTTIWRKSMNHDCIINWQKAIKILETHDCYGSHLIDSYWMENDFHYSGNFWWITGNALQRIGELKNITRYDAEDWIGSIKKANPYGVSHKYANFRNFCKVPLYLKIIFNVYDFFRAIKRKLRKRRRVSQSL
jgi:hypothetical protein